VSAAFNEREERVEDFRDSEMGLPSRSKNALGGIDAERVKVVIAPL